MTTLARMRLLGPSVTGFINTNRVVLPSLRHALYPVPLRFTESDRRPPKSRLPRVLGTDWRPSWGSACAFWAFSGELPYCLARTWSRVQLNVVVALIPASWSGTLACTPFDRPPNAADHPFENNPMKRQDRVPVKQAHDAARLESCRLSQCRATRFIRFIFGFKRQSNDAGEPHFGTKLEAAIGFDPCDPPEVHGFQSDDRPPTRCSKRVPVLGGMREKRCRFGSNCSGIAVALLP